MPDTVLVTRSLGKDFAGFAALRELSFETKRGEVVGLLGPNGAGKTTTMKLLLGLLRPTRGMAEVLGIDCTKHPDKVKARLGYTPDEPVFYDFLTGHETVDFVINMRGENRPTIWKRANEISQSLGFQAELELPTGGYSLGMKKKLAIVLALMHLPDLLLLDEPTNGLDPLTAMHARKLFRAEAERGAAVLLSTHLLDMADALCDRALVLNQGALLAEGTTAELRMRAELPATASLEAAFLKLVG